MLRTTYGTFRSGTRFAEIFLHADRDAGFKQHDAFLRRRNVRRAQCPLNIANETPDVKGNGAFQLFRDGIPIHILNEVQTS